jgi:hypothetical protein
MNVTLVAALAGRSTIDRSVAVKRAGDADESRAVIMCGNR